MTHDMKINTDRLPPAIGKPVRVFCEMFIWGHASNLESVAVYGSAITPNFIPKVSNINLVCIFNSINLETLRLSLPSLKFGSKFRIEPPLFFTMDYITSSLATFPMEFLEIIENHVTIYGDEKLNGLVVPRHNLRLQCEQQIKSLLLRMRQAYLEHGKNQKVLRMIIKDSFNNLFPIFRCLLRLENKPIPDNYEDVIMKISYLYQIDGQFFVDIFRDKRKTEKIIWTEIERIYQDFINHLEIIGGKVERFQIDETTEKP
ncbi:MAG: hypothetical protein C4541_10245 [Candidatus Auribacter fodinae]|jgi:hypothetical protein|uniref:Nucleotidyltransferase domain-containing protein n=1 Tax=Candidatus Auribacter fodinae TaxID=2093366 RepID=A0A3A4R757_9BACT|nr:MAG: hypothetical protein C4541_10245 [Candidatus Auribacter fodinae]